MHKLQMYEDLRDMLEREVKEIEKKGDMTEQSLDHLYKLLTSIKVVDRYIEREKGEANGMGNSNDMRGRYSNNDNSYNDGMSHMWPVAYELHQENKLPPNDRIRKELERKGIYNSMDYGMSNGMMGRDGDGDGRYNESRDNFRDNTSRDSYGYSRDASRKKMVQKLETLMDDTMSENERQAIRECINKIK